MNLNSMVWGGTTKNFTSTSVKRNKIMCSCYCEIVVIA